jgi:hypothetical protein
VLVSAGMLIMGMANMIFMLLTKWNLQLT